MRALRSLSLENAFHNFAFKVGSAAAETGIVVAAPVGKQRGTWPCPLLPIQPLNG